MRKILRQQPSAKRGIYFLTYPERFDFPYTLTYMNTTKQVKHIKCCLCGRGRSPCAARARETLLTRARELNREQHRHCSSTPVPIAWAMRCGSWTRLLQRSSALVAALNHKLETRGPRRPRYRAQDTSSRTLVGTTPPSGACTVHGIASTPESLGIRLPTPPATIYKAGHALLQPIPSDAVSHAHAFQNSPVAYGLKLSVNVHIPPCPPRPPRSLTPSHWSQGSVPTSVHSLRIPAQHARTKTYTNAQCPRTLKRPCSLQLPVMSNDKQRLHRTPLASDDEVKVDADAEAGAEEREKRLPDMCLTRVSVCCLSV